MDAFNTIFFFSCEVSAFIKNHQIKAVFFHQKLFTYSLIHFGH